MDRFLNRIIAWVFGYAWAQCPRCGQCFGGHEFHEMKLRRLASKRYRYLCGPCVYRFDWRIAMVGDELIKRSVYLGATPMQIPADPRQIHLGTAAGPSRPAYGKG